MHLRSRIIILCGLFLALEIGFLYAFYRWDLSQKIFRAEKQQLEKNLGRNMEFLRKELLQLEQTSKLIASLNLLKNASNNDYFQNIMLQQELNLLYIVDDSNQVLFGKIIDLDLLTPFPNEAFLLSLWKEKPQFLKTETLQSQSGIYNSVLGPMLIVSTPFSNQQTTEIAGTLLIGKLLTTEFVQMMRDIIFTNASFWPLEGATLSKKHLDVLNQLIKTDGNFLVEKNDDSLQGYVALSDINQKYNLLLSNIQPRDFRNLAINGLLFISSVVLLIQILLMGIIFWLIGRYTHDPMKALIEQLDSHQSGDNAIILSQQSWGELEPLIESLSHYIANAHQKVIRQNSLAYQQGLYFADQNLIHDVDTIFSPLINGLENLEKDLLSLPTDELEWLLAECKSRKIEHTMDEFQQGCFQKLEKIFEKLIYLQKKSYHSALKLHHEAFRSAIFLRHRAKRLTVPLEFPPMTRS